MSNIIFIIIATIITVIITVNFVFAVLEELSISNRLTLVDFIELTVEVRSVSRLLEDSINESNVFITSHGLIVVNIDDIKFVSGDGLQ